MNRAVSFGADLRARNAVRSQSRRTVLAESQSLLFRDDPSAFGLLASVIGPGCRVPDPLPVVAVLLSHRGMCPFPSGSVHT
jgi:hypothetical protein